MARFGDHLKMHLPHSKREQAREFYEDLLGCKLLPQTPFPDLDLYEFDDGTVLGLFFVDADQALAEPEYLKAPWLEIKVEDPRELRDRLEDFGVTRVDFPDPTRFYFQAPGGQVFRLAALDGGL